MSCYVHGLGAWMPGRPSVDAVLSGAAPVAGAQEPDVRAYPSRLMRGTSVFTRMCAAVAAAAVADAGADAATIPAVFGSAYGEANIAIAQLEMMVSGDGQISPTLFKNSVHNTCAGVFSIAYGNRSMSTVVAAGPLTVAYALLEGQLVLDEGAAQVLVVVGDEALPEPLRQRGEWPPFAAAWVLGREPSPRARGSVIQLSQLQPTAATEGSVVESLREHPLRHAHTLLSAIHHQTEGVCSLGCEADDAWSVQIRCGTAVNA